MYVHILSKKVEKNGFLIFECRDLNKIGKHFQKTSKTTKN